LGFKEKDRVEKVMAQQVANAESQLFSGIFLFNCGSSLKNCGLKQVKTVEFSTLHLLFLIIKGKGFLPFLYY